MSDFRSIRFGFASAQTEYARAPQLLLEGFLDVQNAIQQVRKGNVSIVLGYKGSGKSAIGERLKLISESQSDLFVSSTMLSDFPYSEFKRVIGGDIEPEARYSMAWTWVLLLKILDSLARDQQLLAQNDTGLSKIIDILTKMGLSPLPDLKDVVLQSSKKSFKVGLPKFIETSFTWEAKEQNLQLPLFIQKIKDILRAQKISNAHIVYIDGLDEILSSRAVQYESLAGLLLSMEQLNLSFSSRHIPIRIVILCRTDLFEKIPLANKNKLRQDSALQLDWYNDPRNPKDSNLIRMVSLRAALGSNGNPDVFSTFFPKDIDDKEPRYFLLELTRHTPRDIIQLLNHIQKFAEVGKLTRNQILSGTRSYSIDYFVPEIKDELVGYVPVEHIDIALELFGSMRKRDFWYHELEAASKDSNRFSKLNLPDIIRALFECSAVGNIDRRPGGNDYFTFKYRNRNSSINFESRLILHRGTWKALNLI